MGERLFLETCFDDLKILIIGDVILDHYLIGKVDRISPEAPVPVVLHQVEEYRLGGAANVALNIQAMGATPYLLSLVGADRNGAQLIQLLEENALRASFIIKDKNKTTSCKTRILAGNQHLLRYDRETTDWIEKDLEAKMVLVIKNLLEEEQIDAIIFQDYNKGLLTNGLIFDVLKLAKEQGIKTFADPKKANFLTYSGVDWFKPNLREINEGLGLAISDENPQLEELARAAQTINKHLKNTHTLITLGAKGMYYQSPSEEGIIPTEKRQVADVCGAGDTVISLLSLGVAAGLNVKEAVTLANIAGGQVCEKVGVAPIDKVALLREYKGK
ncbi:MAG: ADP-heptose synthase (EC / D-glycero-beta-D-manno-heptose 7-phosphate kinase [uncultured Aureispira sp.]|uniref:ADP-heptose synthase n=1 Tax=uncultured Aureispira sp. TaxID=1331704 RepID=A0A6S6SHB1_9BACT|nr:MAG: ADP-heptose synthase (EC / D-glycero-beta-D-manno-heptose 7-phosphate kinase [uncultured Aureispira sp.]